MKIGLATTFLAAGSLLLLAAPRAAAALSGGVAAKASKSKKNSKSGKTPRPSPVPATPPPSSAPPPLTQPGLSCKDSDIVYFNSKFAEFMDKLSNAAEALGVAAAANPTAAIDGYVGGVRSGAEVAFATFMEGIAADGFNAELQSIRRDIKVDGPYQTLRYDSLDGFLNGPASSPPLLFGYYALNPLEYGRFTNPNGGQSGYSDCDYGAGTGVGAGTATTHVRTIDVFVATDARTDINGDGFFENESYTGKITIVWEASAGGWLMKQVILVAGALGFTSYGYVDLV